MNLFNYLQRIYLWLEELRDVIKVCNVFTVMAETLKKNGSVLMPMCPTGVLYDLLEVITVQLDQVMVPLVFFSLLWWKIDEDCKHPISIVTPFPYPFSGKGE